MAPNRTTRHPEPPKAAGARSRPCRIEIRLPQAPGRYARGAQPPPAAPTVAPESTSCDGFIVGKVVLPLDADPRDRTVTRRLHYIVGWPGLPAARVAVPATGVRDYVSAWALEDFEYRHAEEEAEAEAEAARRAVVVVEGTGRRAVAPGAEPRKRKAGRPRGSTAAAAAAAAAAKAAANAAAAAAVGSPTTPVDVAALDLPKKRTPRGPSLSTPKKRRIAQVYGEEADPRGDDDEAILRQLTGEDNMQTDAGNSGQAPPSVSQSVDSSRAGSARPGHVAPVAEMGLGESLAMLGSEMAMQPSRPVPVMSGALQRLVNGRPSSTSRLREPVPKKQRTRESSAVNTPVAPMFTMAEGSSRRHADTATPISGFTPAAKSRYKRTSQDTPQRPEGEGPGASAVASPRSAKPKSSTKKSHKEPAPKSAPVEDEWQVKRLEAMKVEQGARYFKVRWEGNWPPDQNPSWEPEENIAPVLVQRFLKKQASRNGGVLPDPGGKQKQQTLHPFFNKTYSSVSEALEDVDGAIAVPAGRAEGHEEDASGEETLLVTEKGAAPAGHGRIGGGGMLFAGSEFDAALERARSVFGNA